MREYSDNLLEATFWRGKNMQTRSKMLKKAFTTAFPYTIPIFAGFWFLGITYGIYMNVSGFSFWYPMLMSITIFAGSIEFVTVNMLLGAFNPLQAFAMTLMINARHLFYGISMLDKFRGVGRKKFYLIFGMCDESFSINYTAMFVVIFMEQWLKEKNHTSSLLGLAISLICLIAFGADNFIIPAMLAILVVLSLLRRPLEAGGTADDGNGNSADSRGSGQHRIEISESGRGGEAQ